MPKLVAIDTGPIVGLFDGGDKFHQSSVDFFASFQDRGITTVATLTEAMFLLDFSTTAQLRLLQWLRRNALEIIDLTAADWKRIEALIGKYADLPADFADASIVAVCERFETRLVASTDRDFDVYKYKDRLAFQNVFVRG